MTGSGACSEQVNQTRDHILVLERPHNLSASERPVYFCQLSLVCHHRDGVPLYILPKGVSDNIFLCTFYGAVPLFA